MHVLDTSTIIALMNDLKISDKIENITKKQSIAITSITVFEILAGMKKNEREKTERVLAQTEVLNFDKESAKISAELLKNLTASGKTVEELDLFIAAICLKHKTPLVTLDKDFERIPNLRAIIVTK